jgi:branched-chain amino acid transport system permease protein
MSTLSARRVIPSSLSRALLWGGAIVALLLLALVAAQSPSWGDLITMTLIWAGLATGWNVVGGFAGQISLGHAGFFGIGAYTSTLLYVNFGVSPWIGIVAAVLIAAGTSWLVGIPSFRFRGPYFALATLAIGLILFNLSITLRNVTLGQAGISVPYDAGFANMIFPETWHYVLLAGGFLLLCIAVTTMIARTRLGYELAAIRDDETAARALGVNAARSKLIAAVISGGIAGGVGTIYSQYILFVTPDSVFGFNISVEALALAVVGGAGTVLGPLLGAIVLVPASQLLLDRFGGETPGLTTALYGSVLIVVVLLIPSGIHGIITRATRFLRTVNQSVWPMRKSESRRLP